MRVLQAMALLGLGAVSLLSCGVPTGSSDDRLALYTARAEIPADNESKTTVTAFVRDAGGDPVKDSVIVFFTASGGFLDPGSAAVSGGLATTTLTADLNPGVVLVQARTEEGLRAETSVRFLEASAGSISLSCLPGVLPADGVSEAQCTADVRLPNGDPVANGTSVLFTTTAGTISGASAETKNGQATVSLRSTSNGATAIVTASSGGAQATSRVVFQDNPPGRVVMKTARKEIQANGTDQATLTATVTSRNGSPSPDGTVVNCTTSAGSLSPANPLTVDGIATTTLTSATFQATAKIVCTAGNVSGSVEVKFTPSTTGAVDQIRLSPSQTTIVVNNKQSIITINVLNSSSVGLPGIDVFLSLSGPQGATLSDTDVVTDADGKAVTTLTSGTASGTATITASAQSKTATTTVTITPDAPQSVVLVVPNSIRKTTSATLTAVVRDAFGNPVKDGTIVTFSIGCPIIGQACTDVSLSALAPVTQSGQTTTIATVGPNASVSSFQVKAKVSGGSNPEQTQAINITAAP